jgi:hypothetical protein
VSHWEGSVGRRFVVAVIVAALATYGGVVSAGSAAAANPAVSAEHAMSAPVTSNADASQSVPSVAFDGTNFLVVWEDTRGPSGRDIFGARVRPDGTVLDATGIPISMAPNDQGAPAVAWGGTSFLVVWHDFRNDDGTAKSSIVGARVSSSGTVLDSAGIPISSTDSLLNPSVAWNGTNFLVAWEAFVGGNFDIRAARVDTNGTVLDAAANVSTASNGQFAPQVASNGASFFVVWQDQRSGSSSDIYGARVSGAGTVVDPAGIPVSTATGNQLEPALAWNGTHYFVAWSDLRASKLEIYGARVDATGSVADGNGILISTTAIAQSEPSISAVGTTFFVVWQAHKSSNTTDVFASRVSAAGVVLDPNRIAIATGPSSHNSPAVATAAANVLVAWQDDRAGTDTYAARVAGTNVLDPDGFLVSKAAAAQTDPDLAFDGTQFFAVWTEWRNGTYDIYGARLSADGEPLDGTGIPIATGSANQARPAVAWGGGRFFVVWLQGGALRGARVSTAGAVLDASNVLLPVATRAADADVAWDGTNFLVVWEDVAQTRPTYQSDIRGARVTSNTGTVVDSVGIAISTATGAQTNPAVASNGTSSFVTWADFRSGTSLDVFGARVNGGTVVDPNGIAVSTATRAQAEPDVASDGSGFQVVWTDYRNGDVADVYGARVSSTGAVVDTTGKPISTNSGNQGDPSIAFNREFFVAWRDERNDPTGDIYGARVVNGDVQDASTFVVAAGGTGEGGAAVSPGDGDGFGVTYSRFAPSSPYGATRAFLRTVAPK